MNAESDLDRLSNRARRETYRDGLLDIVIGVLLFIVALATGRPAFYWMYILIILLLGPGLQRLKARFTYPRIGYVKLPDEVETPGQVRTGVLKWVLGVFVLVALVLTLTGHVTDNLAWRRASPALGGLLFAGGFFYLFRLSGLRRHLFMTMASAAIGVLMVWPTVPGGYGNLRVWALLLSLLSLAIGADVLRRFIRDHPVVDDRMPDVR